MTGWREEKPLSGLICQWWTLSHWLCLSSTFSFVSDSRKQTKADSASLILLNSFLPWLIVVALLFILGIEKQPKKQELSSNFQISFFSDILPNNRPILHPQVSISLQGHKRKEESSNKNLAILTTHSLSFSFSSKLNLTMIASDTGKWPDSTGETNHLTRWVEPFYAEMKVKIRRMSSSVVMERPNKSTIITKMKSISENDPDIWDGCCAPVIVVGCEYLKIVLDVFFFVIQ